KQEDMCLLIINPQTGAPLSLKTLHEHFRIELDTGMARANAKVAESLYLQAVGAPAEFDKEGHKVREEQPRVPSAGIFWAKARMGWRERVDISQVPHYDLSKLSDQELDQFEKLSRKAAATGSVPG